MGAVLVMHATHDGRSRRLFNWRECKTKQGRKGDACIKRAQTKMEAPSTSAAPQRPPCFLMAHGVAKRHNIGTIARSATAFGVKEICLVGSRQYNTFGSHGAADFVALRHFATLDLCCKHLKEVEGCEIVGVEIAPDAKPIHSHPFKGPTAFMLGNEGDGMSAKQMALCDSFVYIPQVRVWAVAQMVQGCDAGVWSVWRIYGREPWQEKARLRDSYLRSPGSCSARATNALYSPAALQHGPGTASLNVAVATSIVLHHFAVWAGYPEREREGAKFVVGEKPLRTTARGIVQVSPDVVALAAPCTDNSAYFASVFVVSGCVYHAAPADGAECHRLYFCECRAMWTRFGERGGRGGGSRRRTEPAAAAVGAKERARSPAACWLA